MPPHDRDTFVDQQSLSGEVRRTYRGPWVVGTFVAIAVVFLISILCAFYLLTPARKKAVADMMAASTPPPTAIFEVRVPAGGSSDAANVATKIRVPAGTDQVRVKVELEPGFETYAVELRPAGGKTIQRGEGRPGAFDLTVSAAAVPPGRYEIAVSGRRTGRPDAPVNTRYFILLE